MLGRDLCTQAAVIVHLNYQRSALPHPFRNRKLENEELQNPFGIRFAYNMLMVLRN